LTVSLQSIHLNPNVYVEHVEDQPSITFMRDRRSLKNQIKDFSAVSNTWEVILDYLYLIERHLRFNPESDISNTFFQGLIRTALDLISQNSTRLPAEQQSVLGRISNNLKLISQVHDSSLKSKLVDLIRTKGHRSNAVLIKYESAKEPFRRVLFDIDQGAWTCMTFTQLKGMKFDTLIIIGSTVSVGSPNQIPERLITSNYAKDIYFLDFPLYPDKKFFVGPLSKIAQLPLKINVNLLSDANGPASVFSNFKEDNEEELELSSKQFRSLTMSKLSSLSSHPDEVRVECKCFLLASGQAVFLPESNGTIDVLNPNEVEGRRMLRKECSQIKSGEFLVLRVGSSDSEAIRAQADSLAGDQGVELRRVQREWKARLQTAVTNKSLSVVESDLRQRGIQRPWIKEWLQAGSIRPQADRVFEILIDYLGMEVESTVASMNSLLAFHKKAGFKFREVLKEAFEEIDLSELLADSYLEMEIEDEASVAKLGAYKCLSISAETYEVPESAVKRIFEHSEGEFWDA